MRPTLELSMIVRSGPASLERCLQSVAGVVDRIIIGQAGPGAEPQTIACDYGAEIIDVPWNDDFAAARNAVLAHGSCDWILVLDADEMLDDTAAGLLPSLLCDEEVWAYDVSFCNYVGELGHRCGGEQAVVNPGTLKHAQAFPACFRTRSTRLFRRDPRIRFAHCVHETILDSLAAAGLRRSHANFVIHHFGYVEDAQGTVGRKDELYYRLALKKLALAPEDYQSHLEAGIAELDHAKQPARALAHLAAAISIEPTCAVAWLYRGICLTRLARYEEALDDLSTAAALNGTSPLVHSAIADVHMQKGSYAEARREYEKARELGDASPLSYAKLGSVEVQLGLRSEGLSKVQQAVADKPTTAELLDILATTALLAGEPVIACNAASRRLSMGELTEFHFILAATIHLHALEVREAKVILSKGSRMFPGNQELEKMLAAS